MRRWLERRIDAILCVVLVAGAVWIAVRRPFGIEPAPSGSLAGALFGGAAVLLANAINRANQRAQAAEESKQRRVKVERLITVELRNVSRNLIDARTVLDGAIFAVQTNPATFPPNVSRYWPPAPLALTTDLTTDLLLLDGQAIDVLVTLESRLAAIRTMMDQVADPLAWLVRAGELSKEISDCLYVLAAAFEWIAPKATLQLPGQQQPGLAVEVLRKAGQPLPFRDL